MVTITVAYTFAPERCGEAEAFLRELVAPTRAEPGCRRYEIYRGTDDPCAYLFVEQYDDDAALDAHRASPHFERFGKHGIQPLATSRVATRYETFA